MTPATLAGDIRKFIHDRCLAAMQRYFPTLRIPNSFIGQRISADFAIDFVYTLKFLHEAGYTHLGTHPLAKIIRTILLQINGPAIETFYSYRVAETLLAFGTFNQDNSILKGLPQKDLDNLAAAVDSTHIYNPQTKKLRAILANNYWAVLARCEFDRQRLGLLQDPAILNACLEKVRNSITNNPNGFFDDSNDNSARFDLYSFDTHLFIEPLWPLLDQKILDRNLHAHAVLMEKITLENGAIVAWGRSIGALSVMMTIEFGALALRDKLTPNPAHTFALVQHALKKFQSDWWADDLVNSHRHKMTFNYRGPYRLLQMTFDLLGKLGWVAEALAATPDTPAPKTKPALFPHADEFIDFRPADAGRRSGVWIFRNNTLAFQLAVVTHHNSDYVATPRNPGLFENPVDSPLLCGVPRLWLRGGKTEAGEIEYAPLTIPKVEKSKNALTLTYDHFSRNVGKDGPDTYPATRTVSYKIENDTLHVTEDWSFPENNLPAAISLTLAETPKRPLAVAFSTHNEHSASKVFVEGMQFWRSFWGPLNRVHQIDFAPAKNIHLAYTLMPTMKVAQGPNIHDYNRSFYDNIPADWVQEIPIGNALCANTGGPLDANAFAADADIVHIGWPEHLFRPHGITDQEYDDKLIAFFHALKATGKKIIWTMHNRRPHAWPKDRGTRVYAALAPLVDAALHHSRWGEKIIRNDYNFNPSCKHYILPHPHFAAKMQIPESRQQLEQKYNLPPTPLRIGLLGRYQKEKQIEMILAAFAASGRTDIQFIYNTHTQTPAPLPANPPTAPNIFRLEREQWMLRQQISEHTKLCDLMVAAHTGDTYLTSGLMADAMGMDIPMLVPHWEFFVEILSGAALYHDNTLEGLTHAFKNLTPQTVADTRKKSLALAPAYAPSTLGPQLAQILRDIRQI